VAHNHKVVGSNPTPATKFINHFSNEVIFCYDKFMNLHRTTGKPDWETLKKSDYNAFQKVAASTHSIVTPANVITIIGLGLVVYGLISVLAGHYWLGLGMLAIGRVLDIVDGVVANSTGTKSPTGEFLDAAVDKIGTLFTIIVLYIAASQQWWAITLILIPQLITPFVSLYKRTHHKEIHPTRPGKLSMATAWVSIIGLLILKAVEGSSITPFLSIVVYAFTVLSFVLGLYALWQYTTDRT
jgi:phosphatidylglycerophosphate synthase